MPEPTLNVEQNPDPFGVLPLPRTARPRTATQNATPPRSERLERAKRQLMQTVRNVGRIDSDGGMEVAGRI